jgi:hypothetical protein
LIADAIPNILKNLEDSNEAWFQLGLSNLFWTFDYYQING